MNELVLGVGVSLSRQALKSYNTWAYLFDTVFSVDGVSVYAKVIAYALQP